MTCVNLRERFGASPAPITPRPMPQLCIRQRPDSVDPVIDHGYGHPVRFGNFLDRLAVDQHSPGAGQRSRRQVQSLRSLGELPGGHCAGVFPCPGHGAIVAVLRLSNSHLAPGRVGPRKYPRRRFSHRRGLQGCVRADFGRRKHTKPPSSAITTANNQICLLRRATPPSSCPPLHRGGQAAQRQ